MTATRDLPYFPFDGRGYQPAMGLAPLAIDQWIEFDDLAAEQLRLRDELLESRRADVLQYSDDAEAACLELNRALREHLFAIHSDQISGDLQRLRVTATGSVFDEPSSGEEALEQLAHLIQEDVCVLSADEQPTLIAGLVSFPSHWILAEKMNQSSDEIHAQVPGFDVKLSKPTNALLQKLQPASPVWRINWTIHTSDVLHSPTAEPPVDDLTKNNVLQSTWLRIERQTLRRLPESRAIIFTIRTYQQRMADVVRDATRRDHLAATLKSLPPETVAYKGLQSTLPLLIQVLTDQ